MGRRHATAAPDRGRFTDEFLEPMRAIGDPVADEPVAAVFAAGATDHVNHLLHSMVHAGDQDPAGLPEPVADYLAVTDELPEWADLDAIGRAQDFFARWGMQISVCLFCASLPTAYACANGVQVLHLTARLDTDARRRIMETGQFLMDVMEPGGLGENGRGRRTIQRVRLMHAAIRSLIAGRATVGRRDLWHASWGHPINQEDLAGTLLSFSYVPAGPLRRLGIEVSDQEATDYLHCWNVIGHQLGLRDDLLPKDLTEAEQLVDAIRVRQVAPSKAGKEMTAALVDLLEELTPGHRADAVVPALIRHLVDDDIADLLGVPRASFSGKVAMELMVAADALQQEARHDAGVGDYVDPFARSLMEAAFAIERGGIRPTFELPKTLAARWKIGVR